MPDSFRGKKEGENERQVLASRDFPGSLSSESFLLCPDHLSRGPEKMSSPRKKHGLENRSISKKNDHRLLMTLVLGVAAAVEVKIPRPWAAAAVF